MIGSSYALLDTNILVYSHDKFFPKNVQAKDLVEKALNGEIKAAIAHQNLLEFIAVITDKKRVDEALSMDKTLEEVEKYTNSALEIIVPYKNAMEIVKNLVKDYRKVGQEIFDVYLVATMLSNGLKTIYTANERDFEMFKGIKAVNPFK